ncbi:type IV pilus biogenesis/stability protein PilW [Granulosicoccaceae sp. 1_MG-2023]|nr:type IV pilus biogenesis/stability protein PilW [Granulosicoccaceae sp. 1_MG-2023]
MMNTRLILPLLLTLLALQACVSTPKEGESRQKAAQYNAQLGLNYMNRQGDLEQARIKLERALEQDDSNPLAHAAYAQLQARVGNPQRAERHFKKAIDLEPLNAANNNAYGVFLCSRNRVDEAIEQFETAVDNRYYKTPEQALDNAGICLLEAGRMAGAEAYLARAVKANPRYSPTLLNLTELNLKAGRLTLADAYYNRYEKVGKTSPRSLLLGYRVRNAQGDVAGARSLSNTLLSRFPQSEEAGELLTSGIDD